MEIEEEVNGKIEERQETLTGGLAFNPGLVWEECLHQLGGRFKDSTCSEEGAPDEYELVRRPPGVCMRLIRICHGFVFAARRVGIR